MLGCALPVSRLFRCTFMSLRSSSFLRSFCCGVFVSCVVLCCFVSVGESFGVVLRLVDV